MIFAAFPRRFLLSALTCSILLVGCNDDDNKNLLDTVIVAPIEIPTAPAGLGYEDSAPDNTVPDLAAVVNVWNTNQRGNACLANIGTNAGVRVLEGFLQIWTPTKLLVDADVTAESCTDSITGIVYPAITKSLWTGIPYAEYDGTVNALNNPIHLHNIKYVVDITNNLNNGKLEEVETLDSAEKVKTRVYLDDQRGKAYSMTTAMGNLTDAWRELAGQTSNFPATIPADATAKQWTDNNIGGNTTQDNKNFIDMVVALQDSSVGIGRDSSGEPGKRFYKYARPYRWTDADPTRFGGQVKVLSTLEKAKSSTPATDGGFPSGHTAEGARNSIYYAYVLPQRYQQLMARMLQMGQSRILAGMHSPLDVVGGRMQGIAALVYNLNEFGEEKRQTAFKTAQEELMKKSGKTTWDEFTAYAQAPTGTDDDALFADYEKTKKFTDYYMTIGLPKIGKSGVDATVPKGAEVLLETRFPYLSKEQRRVVLKTTAIDSGYPVMDDAEGYGRLNLFAAGAGYGNFKNGDVNVTMDASKAESSKNGFYAKDTWLNDISGAGKLTKDGSGQLSLKGNNTFTGGVVVKGGVLEALGLNALGKGDVYISAGALKLNSNDTINTGAKFTQLAGSDLQIVMSSALKNYLSVQDVATLQGTLTLTGTANAGTYTIVSASKVQGKFSKVSYNGKEVVATYVDNKVTVTL